MSASTLTPSRTSEALSRNPIPALRRLSLEEDEVSVVIEGSVSSYYLKQMAQEAVMPLLEGRTLLNRVAVIRHASEKWATAS
jgi:hypothetical protein